jgi:hypothetical protein
MEGSLHCRIQPTRQTLLIIHPWNSEYCCFGFWNREKGDLEFQSSYADRAGESERRVMREREEASKLYPI